jgi:hypothetical protein
VDRCTESNDEALSDDANLLSFARPVLINMLNRPERLRDSLEELAAVVGRPVSVDQDVHLIRPRQFDDAGGFANQGFRSNLDAHLQAARWARDNDVERLLVLEDDIAFAPAWAQHGDALLAQLGERDWHLASLGYLDVWNAAPGPEALDGGASGGWVRFTEQVNGAHAYLVNSTAFDSWIRHLEAVAEGTPGDDLQGPIPSDGAINTFCWVNPDAIRLVAVPNLAGTRPTRSDITPSTIDRVPMLSDLAERVRSWRRRRHGSKVANYK